jgi:hypothetical protein
VTDSGVSFQSGLYTRLPAWTDIRSLSFHDQHWGTGGEMALFVQSGNPGEKNIKINRLYFSGNDLRDFILTVLTRVDGLKVDAVIIKRLEKMRAITS